MSCELWVMNYELWDIQVLCKFEYEKRNA
jgi:hypothetical protein